MKLRTLRKWDGIFLNSLGRIGCVQCRFYKGERGVVSVRGVGSMMVGAGTGVMHLEMEEGASCQGTEQPL
jgi:hypothetical protein